MPPSSILPSGQPTPVSTRKMAVTVSGPVGSGKSAAMSEIEITFLRTAGLAVEFEEPSAEQAEISRLRAASAAEKPPASACSTCHGEKTVMGDCLGSPNSWRDPCPACCPAPAAVTAPKTGPVAFELPPRDLLAKTLACVATETHVAIHGDAEPVDWVDLPVVLHAEYQAIADHALSLIAFAVASRDGEIDRLNVQLANALALLAHLAEDGTLSEGQCSTALGIDRIEWRKICDDWRNAREGGQ